MLAHVGGAYVFTIFFLPVFSYGGYSGLRVDTEE